MFENNINWSKKKLYRCLKNRRAFKAIKENLSHCCVYDNNLKSMHEKNEQRIIELKAFIKALNKIIKNK